jgi:tetratricopeptide (TPR) repeat protein
MIVDYYEMLGVDRGAGRDEIEAALHSRQPEWSARARQPGDGSRYRALLQRVPALRKALLGSPEARAAYDAELAALRGAARGRGLDTLRRLVRLRAAKGGLTVTDRRLLLDQAGRLGLGRAELEPLLDPYPPWPEPPPEPDDEPVPSGVADAAARRRIAEALDAVGRPDLYDLIDLRRDVPQDELREQLAWLRSHGKDAPAPWREALALAHTHLGTPEARARYDRALTIEAEAELDHLLGFALRGLTRLDTGTREALRLEAMALGIAPDRADRLIRRGCRRAGVAIEVPASEAPTPDLRRRLLRCRSCGGLTDYGWAEIHSGGHCRHCHASLRWDCPVCKRTSWVDEPRCACGFPLTHVDPLVRNFGAAQDAFKMKRFAEAVGHLRRVLALAPRHVGARKGVEKVQAQVGEIRRMRADFARERAATRLVAARAILDRWARFVSPTDTKLSAARAVVAQGLAQAEALAARAGQRLEGDPKRARALYRQALAIAADLPEALEGLRRCPPEGPSELFVEPRGGRVLLRWTAPAPDDLGAPEFRVRRARGVAPAHAEDGTLVAVVAGTEWEDADVQPGESYGYAVFAARHGVCSPTGVAAGPFVVTDEVHAVRVEPRPGAIELSWVSPPGAFDVRVVRGEHEPPAGPRDGVPVEARLDGATDRGLADDQVYHYTIFALFRGPDGRPTPSRGVIVTAAPGPPPAPVDDLRLDPEADPEDATRLVVHALWTPLARGEARIVRTALPLAWQPGEHRRAVEIERLEGAWPEVVEPGRAEDALAEGPALWYYTPLTIHAGRVTVGRAAAFAHVADPTDLHATRAPGHPDLVLLRWRWSLQRHGAACRVAARLGRDPYGPDDPNAWNFPAPFEAYTRNGYLSVEMPEKPGGPWHVRVFAVAHLQGSDWYSPGIDPTARVVVPAPDASLVVRYAMDLPRRARGRGSITFRTEPPGAAFGPTVLVAQPRLLPLSPDEGQVIARFPAARDGTRLEFRSDVRLLGRRLRLFPDPEGHAAAGPFVGLLLPDDPWADRG